MKYITVIVTAITLGFLSGAYAQSDMKQGGKPAQEQLGQKHDPGTVGAMQPQTGNLATSPDDVRRQTQGKPTAQQEGLKQSGPSNKTDPTGLSAGAVGAAPGTEAPMPGAKE
jgi:hypothetical protein